MTESDWLTLLETLCRIDSRTERGAEGATRVAEELSRVLASMGFTFPGSPLERMSPPADNTYGPYETLTSATSSCW